MRVSKALLECSSNKQGRDITLTLSPTLLGSGGNGNAFVVKCRQKWLEKEIVVCRNSWFSPRDAQRDALSNEAALYALSYCCVFWEEVFFSLGRQQASIVTK
jgi:hypothetical protein